MRDGGTGIPQPSSLFEARLSQRILGARIVAVEPFDPPLVKVIFEHRGTDADSGFLIVGPSTVRFGEDEEA
jgi:hypothetical protein